jgi:hypothetical protein
MHENRLPLVITVRKEVPAGIFLLGISILCYFPENLGEQHFSTISIRKYEQKTGSSWFL